MCFDVKNVQETAHLFPKLPAGQLQGRLLVAAASILILGCPEMSWSPPLPTEETGPRGGEVGAYLDITWMISEWCSSLERVIG